MKILKFLIFPPIFAIVGAAFVFGIVMIFFGYSESIHNYAQISAAICALVGFIFAWMVD